jgi:CRP-like cAMP-binding protein
MLGLGGLVQQYRPKQAIFSQGDRADTVFYIQEGKVRLSVLSKQPNKHVGELVFLVERAQHPALFYLKENCKSLSKVLLSRARSF